jgi:hypothetical protein
VTETPATAPVFPPGRYGRRRERRHRPWLTPLAAGLVLVAGLLLSYRLYQQYGDPTYEAQVIRYTGITDSQVVIDFQVVVPPGGTAVCAVRARAYDGSEVGRAEVPVRAAPGRQQVATSFLLATRARPFIGEVVRCRP